MVKRIIFSLSVWLFYSTVILLISVFISQTFDANLAEISEANDAEKQEMLYDLLFKHLKNTQK